MFSADIFEFACNFS